MRHRADMHMEDVEITVRVNLRSPEVQTVLIRPLLHRPSVLWRQPGPTRLLSKIDQRLLILRKRLRRHLSGVECGCLLVSLEVLRKLAIALSVSADTLVFDAERDTDEELRLQLEATQRLTAEDKELVKRFINGLLLNHEAKRLAA